MRRLPIFLVFVAIWLAIGYWVFVRRDYADAFVSGMSMSPRFVCEHYVLRCEQCGLQFRISAQSEDDSRTSTKNCSCPVCGLTIIPTDNLARTPGDSVLIERSTDAFKRFEVVAARDPRDPEKVMIKRVVGLPGETISIRDGDLFVNDKRYQKSMSEFRDLAVLVFDSKYFANAPFVVDPSREKGNWRFENGRILIDSADPPTGNWFRFSPPVFVPGTSQVRWEITDYNWFDPHSRRSLNLVGDVAVELVIRIQRDHRLLFELNQIDGIWQIKLDRAANKVSVSFEDELQRETSLDANYFKGVDALQIAAIDKRLTLLLNGHELLASDTRLNRGSERSSAARFSASSPSTPFVIESLKIHRDLYYSNKAPDTGRLFDTVALSDDEYFLLGDYSAVSVDSRSPRIGPLPRSELLGRVHAIAD